MDINELISQYRVRLESLQSTYDRLKDSNVASLDELLEMEVALERLELEIEELEEEANQRNN